MGVEPLSREQAQTVADILALHADEYFDLIEVARERFPDVDWVSLCLPNWADPRPRPVSAPRPAGQLKRDAAMLDAAIVSMARDYRSRDEQGVP